MDKNLPRAVLTEELVRHVEGHRVAAAAFLTFCFEPAFFEQEILPALLDVTVSQGPTVRMLQMEDALRRDAGPVAVYYDPRGLTASAESAKLDVLRVPIGYKSGYFHPKNLILLLDPLPVEGQDEAGPQRLVLASMSANLTRAGWWENVEVCHVEAVSDGEACSFRADLRRMIGRVKGASPPGTKHVALDMIGAFVGRLAQREHLTWEGVLHPQLYCGGQSLTDFLDERLKGSCNELCLEILSPYFDERDARPLRDLCKRFEPQKVRVLLPRDDAEAGTFHEEFYDAVKELPNVGWGRLPVDFVRPGGKKDVRRKRRTVHAKVYRFFDPNRKLEVLFVGSVNLTGAAHSGKNNFETGFLVQPVLDGKPDWWMEPDTTRPAQFVEPAPAETKFPSTPLQLRFDWESGLAAVFWDSDRRPNRVTLTGQGVPIVQVTSPVPHRWKRLASSDSLKIKEHLAHSSFVGVVEGKAPAVTILVQEENMGAKPSLLFSMSAEDILKYWSLLTPEQRTAFIESRAETLEEVLAEAGLVRPATLPEQDSIFGAFAGIYHGFAALKAFIDESLTKERERDAHYRLFGQKYDSLPVLVDRVLARTDGDAVRDYVTLLCAQQLLDEVSAQWPEFMAERRDHARQLRDQLSSIETLRERLALTGAADRLTFLPWFERWFVTRGAELEAAE